MTNIVWGGCAYERERERMDENKKDRKKVYW